MSWDGKKTEPMSLRGYVCAGCRKPGGTLEKLGAGIAILVHKPCRAVAFRRIVEAAKEQVPA